MSSLDLHQLAQELYAAYSKGEMVAVPPSARDEGFDMEAAYAVEAELVRLQRERGRTTVGRKVGYAGKALWRKLKLETLVWAHMYDNTVHYSINNTASLSLATTYCPKIEPEIVLKLGEPLTTGSRDAAAVMEAVEWLALGFEIIDCVFPDWQFKPVDFVAAFGLHAALVIGEPCHIEPERIPELVEQLPKFKLRLLKNGQVMDEGTGKNSLGSPALCLGELAEALSRRPGAVPLAAGELISSGTLTTPQLVAADQEWTAEVEGLDLPSLTLRFTG